MDYTEIILKGLSDKSQMNYLGQYLYREMKKAESNYYSPDEFIAGIKNVLDEWEQNIFRQYHERKKDIKLTMAFAAEKNYLETIERQKSEIDNLQKEDFRVQLLYGKLNPSYYGEITLHDIKYILKKLIYARNLIINEARANESTDKQNEPSPEYLETIEGIWEGEKEIFFSDTDKKTFLSILVKYFENGSRLPDLPDKTFETIPRTQRAAARVLRETLDAFPMKGTLNAQTDYFKIIRLLDEFKSMNDIRIYSILIKGT